VVFGPDSGPLEAQLPSLFFPGRSHS